MAEYAIMAIEADYYQPMTEGSDGTLLTPTLMETNDIIITDSPILEPFWTIPNGGVFVSTDIDTSLPEPVDVEDTEYIINSGKSWKWLNEFSAKLVTLRIEKFFATQFYDQMTTGFYFVPNHDGDAFSNHDFHIINGTFDVTSEFASAQVTGAAGALKMNIHTNDEDGDDIDIIVGTKYWINVLFDGINEVAKLSVFDADNNFTEIAGSPSVAALQSNRQTFTMSWGRTDGHADSPTNTTFSYVGQIVIGLDSIEPIIPTAALPPVAGGDNWGSGGWGA